MKLRAVKGCDIISSEIGKNSVKVGLSDVFCRVVLGTIRDNRLAERLSALSKVC